jgi:hypothetical protein
MGRASVAVVALLLLVVACGSGAEDIETVGAEQTPTATPASSPTPDIDQDGAGRAVGSGGAEEAPGTPEAAPEPGPEPVGAAPVPNRPQPGRYVYDLSGTSHTPFDAGPRSYPEGSRMVVELTREGNTYTARSSSDEGTAGQTTRMRWEDDRVLLTFMAIEVSGMGNLLPGSGYIECRIEPPVEILRFPLSPGPYPTQSFSSRDCSGTAEIEVIAPEAVTDASGRTWQTWRIDAHTTFSYGASIEGDLEASTWLAPELGTDVRTDVKTQGEINRQPFTADQQTLLRSHP